MRLQFIQPGWHNHRVLSTARCQAKMSLCSGEAQKGTKRCQRHKKVSEGTKRCQEPFIDKRVESVIISIWEDQNEQLRVVGFIMF